MKKILAVSAHQSNIHLFDVYGKQEMFLILASILEWVSDVLRQNGKFCEDLESGFNATNISRVSSSNDFGTESGKLNFFGSILFLGPLLLHVIRANHRLFSNSAIKRKPIINRARKWYKTKSLDAFLRGLKAVNMFNELYSLDRLASQLEVVIASLESVAAFSALFSKLGKSRQSSVSSIGDIQFYNGIEGMNRLFTSLTRLATVLTVLPGSNCTNLKLSNQLVWGGSFSIIQVGLYPKLFQQWYRFSSPKYIQSFEKHTHLIAGKYPDSDETLEKARAIFYEPELFRILMKDIFNGFNGHEQPGSSTHQNRSYIKVCEYIKSRPEYLNSKSLAYFLGFICFAANDHVWDDSIKSSFETIINKKTV